MDPRVNGAQVWAVLQDLSFVARDAQHFKEGFHRDIDTCYCANLIPSAASSPKISGAAAATKSRLRFLCANHEFSSLALVNEARVRRGLPEIAPLATFSKIQKSSPQKCGCTTIKPRKSGAKSSLFSDANTTGIPSFLMQLKGDSAHYAHPSCYNGIREQDLDAPVSSIHHTATMNHFVMQMLHSMCSLYTCIWCRTHYAAMFRKAYFTDYLDSTDVDYNAFFDGMRFLWDARNMVNVTLNKPILADRTVIDQTSNLFGSFGSAQNLWRILITIGLNQPIDSDKDEDYNVKENKPVQIMLDQWVAEYGEGENGDSDDEDDDPDAEPALRNIRLARRQRKLKFRRVIRSQQAYLQNGDWNQYETNGAKRRALQSFLEAVTVLCAAHPAYSSLVSYIWPTPSPIPFDWFVRQEWQWYKDTQPEGCDSLAFSLVTDTGMGSDASLSLDAATKLYMEYCLSPDGSVSDAWLDAYAGAKTVHYSWLMH
jgi:hypothetical protein